VSRLNSQLLVSALLRRAELAGGFATILHKGDGMSGVIIVQLLERGRFQRLIERMTDLDGRQNMVRCGPENTDQVIEIEDYISRRKRSDPDLWLVELDVAEGERFAAEVLCAD
jgi:hypothetical protein